MPSEEVIEFLKKQSDFDDGLPWGYIAENGAWYPLPKTPMLLAELGPPPFSVKLPSGDMRHVVHKPD
jgi:hypothetical protein